MLSLNYPGLKEIILLGSSLQSHVVTAAFTYPMSGMGTSFHVGDTVDVSWTSSFSQPTLQMYCGYLEQRERRAITKSWLASELTVKSFDSKIRTSLQRGLPTFAHISHVISQLLPSAVSRNK